MSPDLDPTDGLPSRAALARELLRYKMEEYSEDFACASWLMDLEFQLWSYGDMASMYPRELYSSKLGKELRSLSELAGGWWAWDNDVPGGDNPVFTPLEKWQKVLSKRLAEREI